ncbi:MAG TPA: HAMP domain-containing histidine kinase [Clostridiaceae bacterium]|nr:HAMP domain-containing histidine kinase [Clostridiaceae bacterium]
MEWLKQMSLKKSFFFITMLFLLAALILSIFSILGISNILQHFGSPMEIKIDGNNGIIPPSATINSSFPLWYDILGILQFVFPIVFVTAALLSAVILFYHLKLKEPLARLQTGAERIMQNDLDFSIHSTSKDELGQLCNAFEKMRLELLKSNRELWRQMEERKRLNAAFSHDLRNPVTVLKGSAKIVKKALFDGTPALQNVRDSILLIEEYAGRIETYINAMSGVQRLEELQCCPDNINYETLIKELSDSARLLAMNSDIKATVVDRYENIRNKNVQKNVWIDKVIVFNVAENLIANALRFAKSEIQISLTVEGETLELSVQDDGTGFPQEILQKGAEPFLRANQNIANANKSCVNANESNEEGFHFGMGLYVCRLLCEKHNGSLKLQNNSKGALTTATFKISKT